MARLPEIARARALAGVLVMACGRLGFEGVELDQDGGGDEVGSTWDAGARAAGDAPGNSPTTSADAGEMTCPAGQTCVTSCETSCDYTCAAGANCMVDCPGSDCTLDCAAGANCALHCGTVLLDGNCVGNGGTEGIVFVCEGVDACGAL